MPQGDKSKIEPTAEGTSPKEALTDDETKPVAGGGIGDANVGLPQQEPNAVNPPTGPDLRTTQGNSG